MHGKTYSLGDNSFVIVHYLWNPWTGGGTILTDKYMLRVRPFFPKIIPKFDFPYNRGTILKVVKIAAVKLGIFLKIVKIGRYKRVLALKIDLENRISCQNCLV